MEIKNKTDVLAVENAALAGSRFHDVCMDDSVLDDISLRRVKFNQISADDAVLHHVDFVGAEFDDIDMTGATLRWVRLPKMTPLETVSEEDRKNAIGFEHCNLKGSHFSECNFTDVVISDCDISGLTINGVVIEDLLRERDANTRAE